MIFRSIIVSALVLALLSSPSLSDSFDPDALKAEGWLPLSLGTESNSNTCAKSDCVSVFKAQRSMWNTSTIYLHTTGCDLFDKLLNDFIESNSFDNFKFHLIEKSNISNLLETLKIGIDSNFTINLMKSNLCSYTPCIGRLCDRFFKTYYEYHAHLCRDGGCTNEIRHRNSEEELTRSISIKSKDEVVTVHQFIVARSIDKKIIRFDCNIYGVKSLKSAQLGINSCMLGGSKRD